MVARYRLKINNNNNNNNTAFPVLKSTKFTDAYDPKGVRGSVVS